MLLLISLIIIYSSPLIYTARKFLEAREFSIPEWSSYTKRKGKPVKDMENKSNEKLFKERIQKEMRDLLFEVFLAGANNRQVQPIIDKGEMMPEEVAEIKQKANEELVKKQKKDTERIQIPRNPNRRPTNIRMGKMKAKMRAEDDELLNRIDAVDRSREELEKKPETPTKPKSRKRPPLNPNYKPTTVDMDAFRRRLREESAEKIRLIRERDW